MAFQFDRMEPNSIKLMFDKMKSFLRTRSLNFKARDRESSLNIDCIFGLILNGLFLNIVIGFFSSGTECRLLESKLASYGTKAA